VEFLKNPPVIWGFVGLLMFLMEMAGPGLIILFFGIGAWVVMLVTVFIPMPLNVQLALFLAVSVLSLFLFRNFLRKAFYGHEVGEQDLTVEIDDFTGERARVTQTILPDIGGKVEFRGTQWSAMAEGEIPEGEVVQITGKENLTLNVERIQHGKD